MDDPDTSKSEEPSATGDVTAEAARWDELRIRLASNQVAQHTSFDAPGDPAIAKRLVVIARLRASPSTLAACLFALGTVHLHRHEDQEAAAALEEVLRVLPESALEERVRVSGNIGSAYTAIDPARARDIFRRLIAEAADDEVTGPPRVNALLNLAALEREAGRFELSSRHYREALASRFMDPDASSAAHLGLTNLYLAAGHRALSLSHLAEVLRLERADPPSRRLLQARSALAEHLHHLQLHDEAAELLRSIVDEFTRRGDDHTVAKMKGNLAGVALSAGDLDGADRLAREALTEHLRMNDRSGEITARVILAQVAYWQGDPAHGEVELDAAHRAAAEVEGARGIFVTAMTAVDARSGGASDERAIEWSRRGVRALRQLRAAASTPDARASYFESARTHLLRHAELCAREGPALTAEAAAAIDEAHAWMHVNELGVTEPDGPGLDDLRARLDASTAALILGGRGPDQHAFVVRRDSMAGPYRVPTAGTLEAMDALHAAVARASCPGFTLLDIADAVIATSAAFRELERAAGEWEFWANLRGDVPQRLVIAASPMWLSLPMHALSVLGDGPLIEVIRDGIVYTPSVNVYAQCTSQLQQEHGALAKHPWTAFIDPEREVPGRALPATIAEARSLGADARLFEGPGATAALFEQALREHPLVAFLGHGVADSHDAMETGLIFAAGNSSKITARDLLSRGAVPTQARVCYLDACHAGATSVRPDRPLSGFARALLARGCCAVIGPSWPVIDDVAPLFTDAMARSLRAGGSVSGAVRAGVLEIRRRYPQPFHWAAHRVFGGA